LRIADPVKFNRIVCCEKFGNRVSQSTIRNSMLKTELEARTKRFALSVIQLVGKLPRGKTSDVIGYQLLKSGTSIGASYREVNRA
jgi:hypothetical protein